MGRPAAHVLLAPEATISAQPTTPAPGATLGLDVSDRYCHFCLVDAAGVVRERGRFPTTPAAARVWLGSRPTTRVVLETGARCFRRSEVARLTTANVVLQHEGLVVTLAASKTDQLGEGIVKGVPYGRVEGTCPVRAYRAWLGAADIRGDPGCRLSTGTAA